METKKTGQGGAGRGQGRKPLAPGEKSITVGIRMTNSQREKMDALGGAPWVRDKIDKAKLPTE
jgi:hypothetical protein